MKKLTLLLLSISFIHVQLSAQQVPTNNFYGFNEYLINPAEAGYRNRLEGSLSRRLQWEGINGAPKTSFLGIHGAINEKMGIGGRLIVDKTDVLQQFTGTLSYAYRVNLNEKSKLHFGLSGMVLQNNIRLENSIFKDENDDLLTNGNQEGVTFDAEVGILLEWGNAKIGVSSAHLFESGIAYGLNNTSGTFDRIRLFTGYGSYLFRINEKWDAEPSVLLRAQEKGSFQYEANAILSWQQTLFLGGGYRDQAGFIARLGFQFNERLIAAYAYEFSSSGIASYSNGSHEFMLGYQLFKGKKASTFSPAKTPNPIIPKEEITIPHESPVQEKKEKEEELIEPASKVVEEGKNQEPEKIEVEEIPETLKVKIETPIAEKKQEKINEELFKQNIPFEFERINFSNKEKNRLDEVANELKDFPKQKVLIKGHTCNMGSNETNKKISIQRAKSVKEYLVLKGVDENQIIIKGMLDRAPLVPNNSLENRKKNRRVEFELVN